jgi:hypothetical protein
MPAFVQVDPGAFHFFGMSRARSMKRAQQLISSSLLQSCAKNETHPSWQLRAIASNYWHWLYKQLVTNSK